MPQPPVWTLDQIVHQLAFAGTSARGEIWSSRSLTFSFAEQMSGDHPPEESFSAFSLQQRDAARVALAQFAEVIPVTFTEVAGGSGNGGDIRFHNLGRLSAGSAFAGYPGPGSGGDIFVSPHNAFEHDLGNPVRGQGHGFLTFMHEIGHAMGLGHAGNYNGGNPTYEADALFAQDSEQTTVMSYWWGSDNGGDPFFTPGDPEHAETLMVYDIAALQALYGVNTETRNTSTIYGFNSTADAIYDFAVNFAPVVCIYDAGGEDTLDFSGFGAATLLDLTPGAHSNTPQMTRNVSIAFGTIIENAIGGSGSDTIRGNGADNRLTGGLGNDVIDAGLGVDTAIFGIARGAATLTAINGVVVVLNRTSGERDWVSNAEFLQFSDATVARSTIAEFRPLDYIASHNDLIAAFGVNAQAGLRHFLGRGYIEGRTQDSFDGFEYLATYDDLMMAFGANVDAAARHFIANGFREGRTRDGFDGREYLASHDDLLDAFGANVGAAARHFVNNGFAEGRARDAFDARQYIASYGDLIEAFGANLGAGTQHFITRGYEAGRSRDTFDAAQYLANYADLRSAFGTNEVAATQHYINSGYYEGRTDDLLV